MPVTSFRLAVTFDCTLPPPLPAEVPTPAPTIEAAAEKVWAAVQNRVGTILEEHPEAAAPRRRTPRLENDPDRYIRVVKGGKYQARPIDLGERYDLGLFATRHQARKAILEFWWGQRPSLPKFTKLCHTRTGDRFIALVPDPERPGHFVRVGNWFTTRAAAGQAAARWVRRKYGDRAEEILRRRAGEPTR